jgi:hypothetical protein
VICSAFCIYIDTVIEGPVPVERDSLGKPVVYASEIEAQRCIAEDTIDRLQQFLTGDREYEDAVTVEEYIVEVDVWPDGSIVDANGNGFGIHTRQ